MQIRHRIPTIFNLSMVDVLCCALGCVILLWLLNLREAKQKAEEAGQTDQRLAEVRDVLAVTMRDRDDLRSKLDQATAQLDDLTAQARKLHGDLAGSARQLADTQKRLLATEDQVRTTTAALGKTRDERDAARTDLTTRGKELGELSKALATLKGEKKDIEDRLARQAQDYSDLEKKLSGSVRRVTMLEAQVRDKDSLAEANSRRADSMMS